MSEKLPLHEAKHESAEQGEHHAAQKQEVNHAALENEQKKQLETSRQTAEHHAAPSRLLAVEKDEPHAGHHIAMHQALKRDGYKNILAQTQAHLHGPAKQFSKVIHQKNIETLSNISGQTIARPSGLLGGGLGALAGSITLLYYSKYYGFEYNYAFFFITFAFGFALGLLTEFILRLIKRR